MSGLNQERGLVPHSDNRLARSSSSGLVTPTSLLVDGIQTILERTYNLSAGYRKASDFLWPRKTSDGTEVYIREALNTPDLTCYITDRDFLEHGLMVDDAHWVREPKTPWEQAQVKYSPRRLLFKAGLLPYEGVNPVIFLHPSIMNRIQTGDPAQMLSADYIHDLEMVSQHVSHFLYEQVQYKTHHQFAYPIALEAMAVLDWYLILRGVSLNPDSEAAIIDNSASVRSLADNIRARLELSPADFSLNPWTTHFRKGVTIIGGFLGHIIARDERGEDVIPELHQFYVLSPREKLFYLERLYGEYVRNGNQRYEGSLATVRDKLDYEWEFRKSDADWLNK